MYDAGKIIVGLGIFVVLFTSPFWYNGAVGEPVKLRDLTPAYAVSTQCVEDAKFMREKHMDLLNTWRNDVVRDQDRFFKKDGHEVRWSDLAKGPGGFRLYGDDKVQKSLSNTCMKCHSNYETFCLRCHQSNSVDPFCWDCHLNFSEGVNR